MEQLKLQSQLLENCKNNSCEIKKTCTNKRAGFYLIIVQYVTVAMFINIIKQFRFKNIEIKQKIDTLKHIFKK